MKKCHLNIAVVAGTIFAVAALTLWQKQTKQIAERWMAEATSLRESAAEGARLEKEKLDLREQLQAVIERSDEDAQELKRLRAIEKSFRDMERENVQLKNQRSLMSAHTPQAQKPKVEWVDQTYGPGTSVRLAHCVRWATALANYAREHGGQFPVNLREAVGYLGDDETALRTALSRDQFQILFTGHGKDLGDAEKNPIITEKQPSQSIQGVWSKAYGYADGVAQICRSPDATFSEIENPRKPSAKEQ